jgi:hypothetical protein
MSNYTNRLNRLECAIGPGVKPYRFSSVIDYDERGQCAEVVVYDVRRTTLLGRFAAERGESMEALCARAYVAVGRQPDDGVVERHIIRSGANGGASPAETGYSVTTGNKSQSYKRQ